MNDIWTWFRDEHNRGAIQVIGWLIVAVVGGLWTFYTYIGTTEIEVTSSADTQTNIDAESASLISPSMYPVVLNTGSKLEEIVVLGKTGRYTAGDMFEAGEYTLYVKDVYPSDELIGYIKENEFGLPVSYLTTINVDKDNTAFNLYDEDRITQDSLVRRFTRNVFYAEIFNGIKSEVIIDFPEPDLNLDERQYYVFIDGKHYKDLNIDSWNLQPHPKFIGYCRNNETNKDNIIFTQSGMHESQIVKVLRVANENQIEYEKIGNNVFRKQDLMLCNSSEQACICTWPLTLNNIDKVWTELSNSVPYNTNITQEVVEAIKPLIEKQQVYPTVLNVEILASDKMWAVVAVSETIRNRSIIFSYDKSNELWRRLSDNEFPFTVGALWSNNITLENIDDLTALPIEKTAALRDDLFINWRSSGFGILDLKTGQFANHEYYDLSEGDNYVDSSTIFKHDNIRYYLNNSK